MGGWGKMISASLRCMPSRWEAFVRVRRLGCFSAGTWEVTSVEEIVQSDVNETENNYKGAGPGPGERAVSPEAVQAPTREQLVGQG